MSIASDTTIALLLQNGELKLTDFLPKNIQPASIDLDLGTGFVKFPGGQCIQLTPDRPPEPAIESTKSVERLLTLRPGEFALGRTKQRVTLSDRIVARVEGRSSLGRLGLMVHATAGFIDPGFDGHITLELLNISDNTLVLHPDMSICQLAIEVMVAASTRPYGHASRSSKYQGQVEVTSSMYNEMVKAEPKTVINDTKPTLHIGTRVYHRRADLFGRIETIEAESTSIPAVAFVKYEYPVRHDAPATRALLSELVPDYLVRTD